MSSETTVVSGLSAGTSGTSRTSSFVVPKTESRIGAVMEAIENNARARRRSVGSVSTCEGEEESEHGSHQEESSSKGGGDSTSSKKHRRSDLLGQHPLISSIQDPAENVEVAMRDKDEYTACELELTDFRRHFTSHIAKCTNNGDGEGLRRFIKMYFSDEVIYMHRYKGKVNPYGAKRLTVEGIDAVTKVWLGFQSAIPDGFVHFLETKVIFMRYSGNSQIHAKYTFTGTKTLDVVCDSAETVVMASKNDEKGTLIVAASDEKYSQESTSYSTHSSIVKGLKKQVVSINVLSAITYYINAFNRVYRIENVLTVVTDPQPPIKSE